MPRYSCDKNTICYGECVPFYRPTTGNPMPNLFPPHCNEQCVSGCRCPCPLYLQCQEKHTPKGYTLHKDTKLQRQHSGMSQNTQLEDLTRGEKSEIFHGLSRGEISDRVSLTGRTGEKNEKKTGIKKGEKRGSLRRRSIIYQAGCTNEKFNIDTVSGRKNASSCCKDNLFVGGNCCHTCCT